MTPRILNLNDLISQDYSIFLFGPRGVGKTQLISGLSGVDMEFDFLKSEVFRSVKIDPTLLRYQVEEHMRTKERALVSIDEVQLIPEVLNEVHYLIEKYRNKLNFILTGSSARKLKREDANLLAGRAIQVRLHPISLLETNIDLRKALHIGTLPRPYFEKHDPKPFLTSYVDTYMSEEIKQESLVRKLDAFMLFLELSAQLNGENINFSKLGRQCRVASSTIEQYYSILEDTLLVRKINGWSDSVKKQMVLGPRYYYFDCGVLNAIRRELQLPVKRSSFRYGKLFETYIINEIIRISDYLNLNFRFNYWRTSTGQEIDIILRRSAYENPLAIEIKSSSSPDLEDLKELKHFKSEYPNARLVCVCETDKKYRKEGIEFLPWQELKELLLGF